MRYSGESFQTQVTKSRFEIGGMTNFYDADDPYDDKAVEEKLKQMERTLHPLIDKVIETKNDESGGYATSLYVSMLYNRSVFKRETCRQFASTDKDVKKMHELLIAFGIYFLALEEIDNFKCGVLSTNTEKFITSDNPVAYVNSWEFFKESINYEENTIPDENKRSEDVFMCPLSPSVCAVLYRKDSKYSKQLLENGSYYTVENINRLVADQAIEWVFSEDPLDEKLKEIFMNSTNPHMMDLRKFVDHERRISKQ